MFQTMTGSVIVDENYQGLGSGMKGNPFPIPEPRLASARSHGSAGALREMLVGLREPSYLNSD